MFYLFWGFLRQSLYVLLAVLELTVDQASLSLTEIYLPPVCWDQRCTPPCLALAIFKAQIKEEIGVTLVRIDTLIRPFSEFKANLVYIECFRPAKAIL